MASFHPIHGVTLLQLGELPRHNRRPFIQRRHQTELIGPERKDQLAAARPAGVTSLAQHRV